MKHSLGPKYLPALSLTCGLLVLGLRWLLYATGVDDRGLIPRSDPLNILCWLPVAVGSLVLARTVFRMEDPAPAGEQPSLSAALGCFCAGVGLVFNVLGETGGPKDTLAGICTALGLACAAGMFLAGVRRLTGKPPLFLIHGALALFFALNLADQYRIWSRTPQVQDYVFSLFACVGMMLCAYLRAAHEIGGRRRGWMFWGLMTGILSLGAAVNTQMPVFYLGCGLWGILTCVPAGQPRSAPRFARRDPPAEGGEGV